MHEGPILAHAKFTARRVILHGFDRLGVRLSWAGPHDMRGTTDDPLTAAYLANGNPFVLETPLHRCRGLHGIALGLASRSLCPRVRTLQTYASGICTEFADSPLGRFYSHFQPESAAQALGLDHRSALADLPATAVILPWEAIAPLHRQEQRRLTIEKENRDHGSGASADQGWQAFGPVSQQKGELEIKRLTGVYDSIRQRGYQRHDRRDGDIFGVILLDDHDWALNIQGGGSHRIPALAALGYASAPIRIRPGRLTSFIRRRDVSHWPHVRSGLFTREEALSVFDRMLLGRPPQHSLPPEWGTFGLSRNLQPSDGASKVVEERTIR